MSQITKAKLAKLAQQASTSQRKVSSMQVAAYILEEAVAGIDAR